MASQVNAIQIALTQTETIKDNVKCDEQPLDAVKCLPVFTQEGYVSWWHAAVVAYYIFRNYVNCSRYYHGVIIIRSKIKGPAVTAILVWHFDEFRCDHKST